MSLASAHPAARLTGAPFAATARSLRHQAAGHAAAPRPHTNFLNQPPIQPQVWPPVWPKPQLIRAIHASVSAATKIILIVLFPLFISLASARTAAAQQPNQHTPPALSPEDASSPLTPCSVLQPDPSLEPEPVPEGAWRANLWPGGIVPYTFGPSVTASRAAAIRVSMDILQTVCRVSFVPRTTQGDYLLIQNSTTNNSFIGRIGGAQAVNIFNWNATYVMCHELMHALGLIHEQSRPDRDSFVIINSANIQPGQASNFNIDPNASTAGPYDFESVMHYGSCFFSTCSTCSTACQTITVRPAFAAFQSVIGQSSRLSAGDTAGLISRYGSPTDDSFEPNDTLADAKPLALATSTALQLNDTDDYFSFQLPLSGVITIGATAGAWAVANASIELRTLSGSLYTATGFSSVSPSSSQATLTVNVPAGTWVVRISRFQNWGGSYTLLLSPSFTVCGGWSALGTGANGIPAAAITLPNGDFIVGGGFTSIAGRAANRIARQSASTAAWSALGSGTNGSVLALAATASGEIIAGGSFTSAGGVAANNIARWNGSAWLALGPGISGAVSAVAVMPDGDIIAAGTFNAAGGIAASNIARWNAATSAWSALGTGLDSTVRALAVLPDGQLVAGGSFANAGGAAASRIARWNGTVWQPMGPGMDDDVSALIVRTTGDLIAGGSFTIAGNSAANRIARWNGFLWLPIGLRISDPITSLLALPDGDFISGSAPASTETGSLNYALRWNNSTSTWSTIGAGLNNSIRALALRPDGTLFAGGDFTSTGTLGLTRIAKWAAPGPAVTSPPVAAAVCLGQPATFQVTASGTGNRYQWRKGTTNIPAATSATYTIASTETADAGTYSVAVRNACGGTTVASAALTIRPRTAITTQPVSITRCAGTAASFRVTAIGFAPLGYQWFRNGAIITGARAATYTIASTNIASEGSYTVTITGPCGSVTSDPAILTVTPRTAIVTQPAPLTRCTGTAATFAASATGTGPLTYQWKRNGVNIAGAMAESYTIDSVIPGSAGSYAVVITGPCGTLTSSAAVLTVQLPPTITAAPIALIRCVGAATSFTVTATGTATLSYQWRKDGSPIVGATARSLNLGPATTAAAGSYDVVITNGCASVTSAAVPLVVNTPVVITAQPTPLMRCSNTAASFSVSASGSGPLRYQWKRNGANIIGATADSYTVALVSAATAGSYTVAITGPCGTITSGAAVLTVTTPPVISTQPVAAVRCSGAGVSFAVTAAGTAPLSYVWRKDGEPLTGQTARTLTIAAAAAIQAGSYDVIVSNSCGSVTSNAVSLAVNTPVVITTQPQPVSGCIGNPASLTVVVGPGSGALRYQWKKNNTSITGASAAMYTIPAVLASSAGNYTVTITGPCGAAVTSAAATLTAAPCILQPLVTPPCSLADITDAGGNSPIGDGTLDGDDFITFINAFTEGDLQADIVSSDGQPPADGIVDSADLVAFLNAFAQGC